MTAVEMGGGHSCLPFDAPIATAMIPLMFLAALLAITLAAFVVHLFLRRQIAARLRQVAVEHRMNYSETDRFHVTPRVVERFPVSGASDIKVMDLIYLLEAMRCDGCMMHDGVALPEWK